MKLGNVYIYKEIAGFGSLKETRLVGSRLEVKKSAKVQNQSAYLFNVWLSARNSHIFFPFSNMRKIFKFYQPVKGSHVFNAKNLENFFII